VRALLLLLGALALGACGSSGSSPPGSDLSGFDTARISINGEEYEVWLALTPAQQQQGFMFATEAQLDPLLDGTPRGMLFVFPAEQFVSFWMRNTYVPLDLAYAKADGTIVSILPLTPLDETLVPSPEPVQYALEVFQGTFAAHGVTVSDVIVIPPGTLP